MSQELTNIFNCKEKVHNFNALPFPSKKTEEWIYTNPNLLFGEINTLSTNKGSPSLNFEHGILFFNGKVIKNSTNFSFELTESTPKVEEATYHLQSALPEVTININSSTEKPLFIEQVYETKNSNELGGSNITLNIEDNVSISIIEVVKGNEKGLHSGLTKINLGKNSNVEYIKVLPSSLEDKYLGTVHTTTKRDSFFNGVIITLGAEISRHHLLAENNEENATCNFHGLFSLDKNQHSDTFSFIKHLSPKTYSGQLYKGVLNGESKGVFTGKLYIARDAQEVDANQLSKNLLLSPKAHVDTRPQLEVYADDVKAAHGATVGQIGEEEIFYLQSRGINASTAYKMVCKAFSIDVVDHVKNNEARSFLLSELSKKDVLREEK